MTEPSSWAEQVKAIIADRAYSLNYDEGMQCRFMPVKSEEGRHTIEIHLEMTHSGHPYDLAWFIRYADAQGPIEFELVAPPGEGGTLWKERILELDRLKRDAQVLPVFIRGYFVGRNSVRAAALTPSAPAADAAAPPPS